MVVVVDAFIAHKTVLGGRGLWPLAGRAPQSRRKAAAILAGGRPARWASGHVEIIVGVFDDQGLPCGTFAFKGAGRR